LKHRFSIIQNYAARIQPSSLKEMPDSLDSRRIDLTLTAALSQR
jgi:hypothetical protein